MTYKELKKFCDEKIKGYPEYEAAYRKEILVAKRFYNNGRILDEELEQKRECVDTRYTIPFLIGLTKEVDTSKLPEYVQVRPGASGGIDVDSDFAPSAKEKITEYIREKYGRERVVSVGTYTRLGVSSAAKDLLRIHKIDFKESNTFTSALDSSITWEENLEKMRGENPATYQIYVKHKEILDLTPKLVNKIRQIGKHAGGLVILDRPVYELIPVERVSDTLVSAFPESNQQQVLDELGIIKLDILGITILDVIENAINSIDEKIYLIEEDGIIKAVTKTYINEEIEKF